MATTLFPAVVKLVTMLSLVKGVLVCAFSPPIVPGTGLQATRLRKGDISLVQIVVFEHTEHGTGGLVLNKPAPILLRDIASPRFKAFGSNSLMLGCGVESTDEDRRDNVALGDMSPWFWLHDVDNIPGSFKLPGADGPLFLGGNIEELTQRVGAAGMDPLTHVQFFWKYKLWGPGQLSSELASGLWEVNAQDPEEALRVHSMRML
mmetsp:Transcript_6161/g.12466  ORF Transcript_6161/g.12466 Transcript_6161/m.12466 type:complete len:205 (+) Transcript_6161:159-773(+)|eukprot:CAMPEP_0196739674 /NCGR_PEP_ID=MMETSP1091-20130531/24813_1 /TAXON_ID=302021 /ORGANISM="Rhodomonas sp., Strain CCMP768" /LENGTH=204 /DNA_ID=CAMNT_0042084351 /DNA_START=153 /DNA_END=767 /DNA_ORIENTATION=+